MKNCEDCGKILKLNPFEYRLCSSCRKINEKNELLVILADYQEMSSGFHPLFLKTDPGAEEFIEDARKQVKIIVKEIEEHDK